MLCFVLCAQQHDLINDPRYLDANAQRVAMVLHLLHCCWKDQPRQEVQQGQATVEGSDMQGQVNTLAGTFRGVGRQHRGPAGMLV